MWISYWKTLFTTPSPDAAAYEAYLTSNMKDSGRLNALLRLLQASKANAGNHLETFTLPMIIGMGSTDPDFRSPEAEAQFLYNTIRSSVKKIVMYPNVKHYPQVECPSDVARDLLEAAF
ncbi:hypothetical protein DYB32_000769 [Aphanomyces invadans]|nr:hypothetical protein DYB32_000769 [Aphanomyces invadans]